MGGGKPTVTVGISAYRVRREPGADWATLEGPRGSLVHAREVQEAFVWRLWKGCQDTVGWAVEDGPAGLRVVSEDLAGWLLRLGRLRPDLEELLRGYAGTPSTWPSNSSGPRASMKRPPTATCGGLSSSFLARHRRDVPGNRSGDVIGCHRGGVT